MKAMCIWGCIDSSGLICFLFLRKNIILLPLIWCIHCCLGTMQLMPDLKAYKLQVTGKNKLCQLKVKV